MAPIASAHVLGQDHNLGVELHLDPDDTPIAGQLTIVHLFFAGTRDAAGFTAAGCKCQVVVKHNGQTIPTAALTKVDATTIDTSVTFPATGTYSLTVSGSSATGAFPSFSIPYTIHVNQSTVAWFRRTQFIENAFILGGVAAILVLVLCWRLIAPRRQRP